MKWILLLFMNLTLLYAHNHNDAKNIATKFNLYAGTKAIIQWERIFSSQRRLEKYKLNQLSIEEKAQLKLYLIEHAADSEQPIVPGL